jgi:hypothetical protein
MLKLSGEALANDKGFGIDPEVVYRLAGEIKEGFFNFSRKPIHNFRINTKPLIISQCFTTELQHDSFVLFLFRFHPTPPD